MGDLVYIPVFFGDLYHANSLGIFLHWKFFVILYIFLSTCHIYLCTRLVLFCTSFPDIFSTVVYILNDPHTTKRVIHFLGYVEY